MSTPETLKRIFKTLGKLLQNSSTILFLGFWIYLILCSVVYYYIENPFHEPSSTQISVDETFCRVLIEKLNQTNSLVRQHLDDVTSVCNDLIANSTIYKNDSWDFSGALFFTMSAVTTIGYGIYTPVSDGGKVFVIVFGFCGISLCAILLAKTSSYFSVTLLRIYEKRRKRTDRNEQWYSIVIAALVFLLPGLGLFVFIPSIIFSVIEGWTYVDSLYFSYVTLTTIGFGDIVPTWHIAREYLWLYRVSWLIWVYLGISYWAIIINFISKALESKKLRNQWKQTIRLMGQGALEQFSPGLQSCSFVASTSKPTFDFALHMTESVGKLRTDFKGHWGATLPGIATALKPTPGRGLMALIQMSAGLLGKRPDAPPKLEEGSGGIRDAPIEQPKPFTTMASSDSGIGIDSDDKVGPAEPRRPRTPEKSMVKSDTSLSLPLNLGAIGGQPSANNWNLLRAKSLTRPDFGSRAPTVERQSIQELILQAVTILNEAQTKGSALDLA